MMNNLSNYPTSFYTNHFLTHDTHAHKGLKEGVWGSSRV
jgi:hypothetical protein